MRRISKIDGGLRDRDSGDERLEPQEERGVFKRSLPATFFAGSRAPDVLVDALGSLKKSYGFCFNNTFAAPVIMATDTSLSVVYPVCHHIHRGYSVGQPKWDRDGFDPQNETKFSVYSHAQLKFTRIGEHVYLNVECKVFSDLYDYDVTDLLNVIGGAVSSPETPSEAGGARHLRVNARLIYPDAIDTEVSVRQLVINDGVDLAAIQTMLDSVYNYYANCLKRFEELTLGRETEVYDAALRFGAILLKIGNNYRAVGSEDYQQALASLAILEANATYQNDPHIWMSMTKIRDALIGLSEKALIATDGIRLESAQLPLILNVLGNFEGVKPLAGNWFPAGTIQTLTHLLTDLVPELEQQASLGSCAR